MHDAMIDMETLSTRNNAVILTVGAIKFDRHDDIRKKFVGYPSSAAQILETLDSIYFRIDKQTCIAIGMHVDPGTERWWDKQKPEAKAEAYGDGPDRLPISIALDRLYLWFGATRHPWSHGVGFDVAILEHAYATMGKAVPWHYAESRDTRTLFDITKLDRMHQKALRGPSHHHALFDAYDQIVQVQESFRRLRSNDDASDERD